MKYKIIVISLLSIAAFAAGCTRSEETAAVDEFDNLKAEGKEAAQDARDYAYSERSVFVEKMKMQLAGIKSDLDELSAKMEKSSDSGKAQAKPKLQALRVQANELNLDLDKAQNATEATWDEVKAGSRKTYDSLKEGFQQVRQWASEQIAP